MHSSKQSLQDLKLLNFRISYCLIVFAGKVTFTFYRAMHFSAKRGIAIACRLSVRPTEKHTCGIARFPCGSTAFLFTHLLYDHFYTRV